MADGRKRTKRPKEDTKRHLPSLEELGTGGKYRSQLEAEDEKLATLLARQKVVAKEMHDLLAGSDGLIAYSRAVTKNYEAAIAQSRVPGYWKYVSPSDRVKTIEHKRLVEAKAKEIEKIQQDIDRCKAEIDRLRSKALEPPKVREVTSLDQWFKLHGRPAPDFGGEGFATTFDPPKRVYGGTKHYPGFRSVATTMKPGRATK